MKKTYATFVLILFTLTGCKKYIDINNVVTGEHELSYIKGTNTLVTGKVVRKTKDGKIVELHNYTNGEMIGDWFQYNDKGKIMSHGFGREVKNYEKSINGFDLTYSILSIVEITDDFAYATLYMDNNRLFEEKEKLIQLSKDIFADYSDKYKIDELLIVDSKHVYTIAKSATTNSNYTIDTVAGSKIKKLNFR
jgi:hypothetical protein